MPCPGNKLPSGINANPFQKCGGASESYIVNTVCLDTKNAKECDAKFPPSG